MLLIRCGISGYICDKPGDFPVHASPEFHHERVCRAHFSPLVDDSSATTDECHSGASPHLSEVEPALPGCL